jgi:hypothetical protein
MHYTIGYIDYQRKHHEICEYAENTYDAMQHAKEDVPFLKECPHCINEVLREDNESPELDPSQ